MNIAVCDDNQEELWRILSFLDTYRLERKAPIRYKAFCNAIDMLADVRAEKFSLYLLDVMMPGLSGMEAAQEIRDFDAEAKLVFLTSSSEFAYQSYSVKAHDYLLKPAKMERLFPLLDGLLAQQQRPQESLVLSTRGHIARILFSNLAYVEVCNKRLSFHLGDGGVQEVVATLTEFESTLLSRSEFIRIHRSYIVNLWHVASLSSEGLITLAGDNLPVSRLLYGKVRDAYVAHLFLEKVVERA